MGKPGGYAVTPGVESPLPAARRVLPFRLGRQADGSPVCPGLPRTIRDGVLPAHANDGKVVTHERRMRPAGRRLMRCLGYEAPVLTTGDRVDAQLEWIDVDAVRRTLVFVA